jgi:hypothetical protein
MRFHRVARPHAVKSVALPALHIGSRSQTLFAENAKQANVKQPARSVAARATGSTLPRGLQGSEINRSYYLPDYRCGRWLEHRASRAALRCTRREFALPKASASQECPSERDYSYRCRRLARRVVHPNASIRAQSEAQRTWREALWRIARRELTQSGQLHSGRRGLRNQRRYGTLTHALSALLMVVHIASKHIRPYLRRRRWRREWPTETWAA